MTQKPLILITPSYTSDRKIRMPVSYQNAVMRYGAIGVLTPYTEDSERIRELVADFDAFLFAGGVDVDPIHYGEEKQFDSVEIDRDRDAFELLLAKEAIRSGKPILGICRGMQLLNVALGGTLYQHLDGHKQKEPSRIRTHEVKISDTSRLSALLSAKTAMTNSFHHQAVKSVAPALRAAAWADSECGPIVEAVESETHPFFYAVQWHPELTLAHGDRVSERLFEAFIRASKLHNL